MGIDIRRGESGEKGGCRNVFHCSYHAFMFMRLDVAEAIRPGLGWLYYKTHGAAFVGADTSEFKTFSAADLSATIFEAVYTFLRHTGYRALADHFFWHSDCGGSLTAKQCKAVADELDSLELTGLAAEFRSAVRSAADEGGTLYFS